MEHTTCGLTMQFRLHFQPYLQTHGESSLKLLLTAPPGSDVVAVMNSSVDFTVRVTDVADNSNVSEPKLTTSLTMVTQISP